MCSSVSVLIYILLSDYNIQIPQWEYYRVFQKVHNSGREYGSRIRIRASPTR